MWESDWVTTLNSTGDEFGVVGSTVFASVVLTTLMITLILVYMRK